MEHAERIQQSHSFRSWAPDLVTGGANKPEREPGRLKIKEVFPDITLGHSSSGQIKNRLLCCPDHMQTGPTHRPCLRLLGLSGKLPEFLLDEVLRAAVLIVPSATSHPSYSD